MMKRLLSVLLVTVMLLSALSLTAASVDIDRSLPFTDVKEGAWYYEGVKFCYNMGVVKGMTKNTFEPNGTLTRAQFVQILAMYAGAELNGYKAALGSFDDVKPGHWFNAPVCWAVEKGFVAGLSESRFGPNEKITREQLARLFYLFAQSEGYDVEHYADLSGYEDEPKVSPWAYGQVEWAVEAGIISGTSETTLDPKASATRAQVCRMVMNLTDFFDYGYTGKKVDVYSKEARTPILKDNTLSMASKLPAAAWNSLPLWNGVAVPNMQEYDMEYDGQPQKFQKEDMENISGLGFNFVRVPLDTRYFFYGDKCELVHLKRLINLDELITWGAEFGTHICLDVHFSFGFTTDGNNNNDTIWEDHEEQELFLLFWDMLAQRYKDVPSNLLSFNLLNEPNFGLDEEVYTDLMRRAIKCIRTYTPDRLIFVDMLNTARDPVYSLAGDRVAQSFHFYEPGALTGGISSDGFGSAYPVFKGKGFITKSYGDGDFVIEGSFPKGTKLLFSVDEIHKGGILRLTADGKNVFSTEYGFDSVGENGCTYIEEAGTVGEYRGYNKIFNVELPEDCSCLRLFVEGECHWFNLNKLQISAGDKHYRFEQNLDVLPECTSYNEIPNPHIVIDKNGKITDDKDILFAVVDAQYINDRFGEYKAFSEETGVAVMMQEFGVYYTAPYQLTLEYLNDLLDAANENNLNWCGWDYFGPYSFYQVAPDRLREGATYTKFSNGWIATEMLDIFQKHLTQ